MCARVQIVNRSHHSFGLSAWIVVFAAVSMVLCQVDKSILVTMYTTDFYYFLINNYRLSNLFKAATVPSELEELCYAAAKKMREPQSSTSFQPVTP